MPTTRPGVPGTRPSVVPRPDPLLRNLLGAVLRDVRTDRGLTLREVAERARVSMPYLSEVERGRKEPSSEVLAAVARALGLRLRDLLGLAWDELADRSTPAPAGPRPRTTGPSAPAPSTPAPSTPAPAAPAVPDATSAAVPAGVPAVVPGTTAIGVVRGGARPGPGMVLLAA